MTRSPKRTGASSPCSSPRWSQPRSSPRWSQPRLRRALSAAYGTDAGYGATAKALAWAREHWYRVADLDAPVRHLYRVAQTRSRRPKMRVFSDRSVWADPWIEPAGQRVGQRVEPAE